ncbi:MAG: glycosyltransferase family 2 protein [Candidatus Daviesbacteria bacterium]|nr:glycosyltransferase family 2 protein [Candidatus Daviesbacteria bacterium]
MNSKNDLSLIIHTKNEEANIKECIMSARSIASEIIVVDMQSVDKTAILAKELEAKVYLVPDHNYADPVRNYAISKATKKWILILDADERISEKLSKQIEQIILADEYDVVAFPRKNIHFGQWIKHTAWWPDYQHRLFKKGFVKCPDVIHKRYKIKGRILELPPEEENSILHYQTKNSSDLVSKIDRYTSLEKYFENEGKFSFDDVLNYMDREFQWRFFEEKGYLDGMRGFVLSKFMEYYRFLVFVKYWEKHNYPEVCSPTQLKDIVQQRKQHLSGKGELSLIEKDHLNKIINSKFYKLWRIYCNNKDMILNIIKCLNGKKNS